MNAIIQSLVSLKPFVSDLRQKTLLPFAKDSTSFYAQLVSVIDKLQTSLQPVNPRELQNTIHASYQKLEKGRQQDAHEFVVLFLDCLDTDIQKFIPAEKATSTITEKMKQVSNLPHLCNTCRRKLCSFCTIAVLLFSKTLWD